MRVAFWGTRGSIPSPGPETIRYGGNTPCVEVALDNGETIILDAGTGIRRLGIRLGKREGNVRALILITHSHWDHIQGFPFFGPAFNPKNHFVLLGPEVANRKLDRILANQQERTYFPVHFEDLQASMEFVTMNGKSEHYEFADAVIDSIWTNHTIDCLGYRLTHEERRVVYIPDNELGMEGGTPDKAFVEFAEGADLLMHDAMYSEEEYATRQGWGHSTYRRVASLAAKAGVKRFVLFHHDPMTSDDELDRRVEECRKILADEGASDIECFGAAENVALEL